ncbi:MAG: polysulfide reductase NrfD, partial [Gemmatimonadetes bacterium]|nr:polysulfide reductase NrfD [Gemmatimonadota bacterium]
DEAALDPAATQRAPASFAWADVVPLHGEGRVDGGGANGAPSASRPRPPRTARSGAPLRAAQEQGLPASGPIHVASGKMAGEMVRNVYNAQHRMPWHWPVPAYLVTKGAATGIFMLLGVALLFGLAPVGTPALVAGGLLSLVLTAATTALLVFDLERPERFLSILLRPQWRSWLTRGAVLLVAFTAWVGLWWVLEVGAAAGFVDAAFAAALRPWAFGVGVPLAIGVAVYTAFLFGQAEGRDLWQSPLLPAHLLVQAVMAGAASLLCLAPFVPLGAALMGVTVVAFALALLLDLLVTLGGEFAMPHASADAARAAAEITRGRYRGHFWMGSVGLGHAVPLALLASGNVLAAALAGLLSLVGLYLYEYAFVMAPQEIPNS